jgi:hypothetical protein
MLTCDEWVVAAMQRELEETSHADDLREKITAAYLPTTPENIAGLPTCRLPDQFGGDAYYERYVVAYGSWVLDVVFPTANSPEETIYLPEENNRVAHQILDSVQFLSPELSCCPGGFSANNGAMISFWSPCDWTVCYRPAEET